MHLLRKFLDNKFERINNILSTFYGLQDNFINLVACVSFPFKEVMEIMVNPMNIIPTEGVSGSRYFPATKLWDEIENYGEELVRIFFKLEHDYKVSIQPHSGTQANQIVFNAILSQGDTVISMSPSNGGHISHKLLPYKDVNVIHYGVKNDGWIDYNQIEELCNKYRPKLVIAGGSSYPRAIDIEKIAKLAKASDSLLLADIAHTALFIASEDHPNVFPFADFATLTLDKNLRGPQGGILIYKDKFKNKIEKSIFPKTQGGPLQSMMLSKVVGIKKLIDINIKDYSQSILFNGRLLANTLISEGINVVSEGTDTHIILINLENFFHTGIEVELLLEKNNIYVNRNLIPNDRRSPLITSGIRLGVTLITNLGYTQSDVEKLGKIISEIIKTEKYKDINDILKLITKYKVKYQYLQ